MTHNIELDNTAANSPYKNRIARHERLLCCTFMSILTCLFVVWLESRRHGDNPLGLIYIITNGGIAYFLLPIFLSRQKYRPFKALIGGFVICFGLPLLTTLFVFVVHIGQVIVDREEFNNVYILIPASALFCLITSPVVALLTVAFDWLLFRLKPRQKAIDPTVFN